MYTLCRKDVFIKKLFNFFKVLNESTKIEKYCYPTMFLLLNISRSFSTFEMFRNVSIMFEIQIYGFHCNQIVGNVELSQNVGPSPAPLANLQKPHSS